MYKVIKPHILVITLLSIFAVSACTDFEKPAETTDDTSVSSSIENTAITEDNQDHANDEAVIMVPSGPLAYVPNEKDGTVSVIDTATDQVVDLLPKDGVLGQKIQAVAMHPDGKTLYVVVRDKNAVAELDLETGLQTAIVKVGDEPEGIDIPPDGKTLVACLEEENAVSFVDLTTATLAFTAKTQGTNPEHCVYSTDGKWVLASNEESGDVDVFDVEKKASVHLINATKHPRGIDFTPDGKFAYIANEAANLVEVVSVGDWNIVAKIEVGLRSNGVKISHDGTRVYVSNGGDGNVSVIETATNTVLTTVPVGERPWNMALTPDDKKLYVANGRSGTVSVIDTELNKKLSDITVGSFPWGVIIH